MTYLDNDYDVLGSTRAQTGFYGIVKTSGMQAELVQICKKRPQQIGEGERLYRRNENGSWWRITNIGGAE